MLAAPNQLDLAFAKFGVRLAYRTVEPEVGWARTPKATRLSCVVVPNCAFFAAEAEERLPDKVEEISGAHPAEAAGSSIGAAHDSPRLQSPPLGHPPTGPPSPVAGSKIGRSSTKGERRPWVR